MIRHIEALAHAITLSWGWRRLAISVAAGACGALAMPPFGFLPALVVCLVPTVWLLDGCAAGRPGRRLLPTLAAAASVGWGWGFGYFVAGLWWLGEAFLVEADQFAFLLPLGVLGLPAVLAVFPAFGFALARLLWSPGPWRVFALAVGLGASEWLRGHLFTGFPWNLLGMALGQNLLLMQSASVFGVYGLTVLVVPMAAAPAVIATSREGASRWWPSAFAVFVLAALAGYGALRLPSGAMPGVAGVRLRIMQPNLPQDAKFSAANRDPILDKYLALSDRPASPTATGIADVTHLIWPESAFPFLLQRDARALGRIAALLPAGRRLVTGAARSDEPLPGERPRFYNSILVIGDDGVVGGAYDKVHLVPFGEYLPGVLDGALRLLGLRQFVPIPGGFTAGSSAGSQRLLEIAGLPPVAATICYEAIFPGAIVPGPPAPRAGLILNVTNDAWFGDTPGPRQHFAQVRLRAVEEGVPVVRAANTGISAIVDPYGRVVASLPVGAEGVLDSALPRHLSERTPFENYGTFLSVTLLLLCAGAALIGGAAKPRLRWTRRRSDADS